jgi:hypothetical protein
MRADWHSGVVVAALATWLSYPWHDHLVPDSFVVAIMYGAAYQRVDPFYRAREKYLAGLETKLRLQNEQIRRERESPSLQSSRRNRK